MDQRRDIRFETKQPVRLTILGKHSREQDTHLTAVLVNLSGRGLSFTTESNVPIGSAVRVDVNDNILLGEVCHAKQTGPSSWLCGMNLEHSLHSVHDLRQLMSALMGEAPQEVENPIEKGVSRKQRRK